MAITYGQDARWGNSAATANEYSKFTVILSRADAAGFDALALQLRRSLGRRVAISDVIRALVVLAAGDARLRGRLARALDEPASPSP
jgi:hypothetical protein